MNNKKEFIDVPIHEISMKQSIKNNWQLYIMLLLPLSYLILFKFIPLIGLQLAFKDFSARSGVFASSWSKPLFKYFIKFFHDYNFVGIIKNTFLLSIYNLIAGFPFPIIFAIALNYTRSQRYKKIVQMVTYAPHFISVVVLVGMLNQFFQLRGGLVNEFIMSFGGSAVDFFSNGSSFSHMYVWSDVWQNVGFNSIIYISALSSVDPSLHEAAIIDGASKLQRIWNIDIQEILPTAMILLILQTGQILNIGYEKVLLMQNGINIDKSEIISTYVYKMAFGSSIAQFSYSTAIGLFQAGISLIIILLVNKLADKIGDYGMF